MKRILLVLIFIVNGVSLSAQTEVVRLQSFLKVGEQLDCGKYSIVFKEVLVDSRCPKNVTCIRAGNARLLFEVKDDKGRSLREVEIYISDKINLYFKQYQPLKDVDLKVTGLAPYPKTPFKIEQSEYKVAIQLDELLN